MQAGRPHHKRRGRHRSTGMRLSLAVGGGERVRVASRVEGRAMRVRAWVLLLGALACAGCGKKEKATPELVNDLKGANEHDRVVAARTLPERKGDATQVVPALIEALKDKEADVRRSAAIGLGTFGEQAKDAI